MAEEISRHLKGFFNGGYYKSRAYLHVIAIQTLRQGLRDIVKLIK